LPLPISAEKVMIRIFLKTLITICPEFDSGKYI
jgi:hypothetical protein